MALYNALNKLKCLISKFRNYERLSSSSVLKPCTKKKNLPNVIFFGTDSFALASLSLLYKNSRSIYQDLKVVTVPSKGKFHAVYKFCLEKNIPVIPWPIAKPIVGYDLGIVVSFGYLIPQSIIESFPLGILNVHGSLLPRWRGAAPVIHSVLNGDKETGITIMKIHPFRFDVGEIVHSKALSILPAESSKELTERLGKLGSECLVECTSQLHHFLSNCQSQPTTGITKAPKVCELDCQIFWDKMVPIIIEQMYYAFNDTFRLWTTWCGSPIKLLKLSHKPNDSKHSSSISEFLQQQNSTDVYQYIKNIQLSKRSELNESKKTSNLGNVQFIWKSNTLRIECLDGQVEFKEILIKGKKMLAKDFYNGYLSKVKVEERKFY